MRREFEGPVGLAVAAVAAMLLIAPAVNAVPVESAVRECTITAGEPIPIQDEPVITSVRHSEALEGRVSAGFPEESRIAVVAAAPVEGEPMTVRLTLRTSEAVAGEWDLTLQGDTGGECTGKVRVGAGSGGSL